jgi:23S rRNA (guanosine2251-2'-O)-methyltransferase
LWLYGRHVALAVAANPAREIERVRATENFLEAHGPALLKYSKGTWPIEKTEGQALDRLLGSDSVHQGIAVATKPLDQPSPTDIRPRDDASTVVILDQASDPRNVGAVIRAAAAFGAIAVITTERGAPMETAVLAKAAAGAFETIPYIQAPNLARAIDALKTNGFWTVGLDGAAEMRLADAPFDRPTAILMGAEGRGLRRLTAEAADALVRIPIAPGIESLNVATAAAIALYERQRSSD